MNEPEPDFDYERSHRTLCARDHAPWPREMSTHHVPQPLLSRLARAKRERTLLTIRDVEELERRHAKRAAA